MGDPHQLLSYPHALTALNGGELGGKGGCNAGITQLHDWHTLLFQILQDLTNPLLQASKKKTHIHTSLSQPGLMTVFPILPHTLVTR